MFGKWRKSASDPTPKVVEIALSKDYRFMYQNFVIATQDGVYLLLEKNDDSVSVLYFDSPNIKYGSPNDEARGGHPLWRYGMDFYGFFEVLNSPWIREQMIANRVHHMHRDSMFDGRRHFIACFQDVMFEVTCRSYQEKVFSVSQVTALVHEQLESLVG